MRVSPPRGERRRQQIAEAALDLFLERGFGASIDDVAEAAMASKQTIYRHFGGHEGLARAAMQIELERVIGPVRAAVGDDLPATPDQARSRLSAFAEAYQGVLLAPDCLALQRYVIGAADRLPALGRIFSETVLDGVIAMVRPLVEVATGADAARAGELAEVFLGTVHGTELSRALAGLAADPVRLAALRARAVEALPR